MSSRSRWNSWKPLYNGVREHRSLRYVKLVSYQQAHDFWLIAHLQLTDTFEGSVIRVFRRLGELLRQMAQAAKVIGNAELQQKFEKSSELLERPNSVIFCSSLYL